MSKQKGSFRLNLDIARGFNFEGDHLADKGISPSGAIVDVPQHQHVVSLDFTRFELQGTYTFADNWDVVLRVPYEIKERDAKVELVDPATPAEQMAMQNNLNIHHPDETLKGFSDFHFLISHLEPGLLQENDSAVFSLGTSIPVGKIEEDPFVLGDAGLAHEHIQFGTGTFDPLLEVYYSFPFAEDFRLGAFSLARFPVYENRKEYQGPAEITTGVQLNYLPQDWLSLHTNFFVYRQDFAHWDGRRDINSGLVATQGTIGTAVQLGGGLRLGLDLIVPLSQRTLTGEGDTFERGPVVLFSTSYVF